MFTKCKYDGIFESSKTHVPINVSFNFDIIDWVQQAHRTKSLKEFEKKDNINVKFSFNKHQIKRREYLFNRFNEDNEFDRCIILQRSKPLHKILRNYEYTQGTTF
jgi:hypothetical protein